MPRAEFLFRRVALGRGRWRPLDTAAQEALKVLGLPPRDILLMNGGLILEKKIKLGLGNGVAFNVDLEAMGRLYWPFGRCVDRPFECAVLGFMYG